MRGRANPGWVGGYDARLARAARLVGGDDREGVALSVARRDALDPCRNPRVGARSRAAHGRRRPRQQALARGAGWWAMQVARRWHRPAATCSMLRMGPDFGVRRADRSGRRVSGGGRTGVGLCAGEATRLAGDQPREGARPHRRRWLSAASAARVGWVQARSTRAIVAASGGRLAGGPSGTASVRRRGFSCEAERRGGARGISRGTPSGLASGGAEERRERFTWNGAGEWSV